MKKIFLFLSISFLLFQSCSSGDGNSTTNVVPAITTTVVSSITTESAVSGGTISSDGGATITNRGVCWSTSSGPTISLSTKTNDGSGIGSFISSISVLIPNTTYYLRAYATNEIGTSYGNQLIFTTANNSSAPVTDIDGNIYQTVQICDQLWTKSNLNASHYRNGDVINQVTDPSQWANLTTGAWCYYQNNTANGIVYGKLYNWYAVNDSRGLAPAGWHIPSDSEWSNLITCLGGETAAGGKIKESGTIHWTSPNTSATNESGFTGLPGGLRGSDGTNPNNFPTVGGNSNWWSSSQYNTSFSKSRNVKYNSGNIISCNCSKNFGFSVRCIKD